MANYPQYQYLPQQTGYQPQMQPYQQQYQPVQNQLQQDGQFYCRPVASEDEARGAPVDFSGRPLVFPHLSAGWIYVKAFDQASGNAVFRRFRMYEEPAQDIAPHTGAAYAPVAVVEQIRKLEETVAGLQQELIGLKRQKTQITEVNAHDE